MKRGWERIVKWDGGDVRAKVTSDAVRCVVVVDNAVVGEFAVAAEPVEVALTVKGEELPG